jgi:hypothetical protein
VKLRHWLAVFALAATGAGVIACAADEDLNPQPLPPGEPTNSEKNGSSGGDTVDVPASGGSSGNASSSSGGGSSGASANPDDDDAGADAATDASDQ